MRDGGTRADLAQAPPSGTSPGPHVVATAPGGRRVAVEAGADAPAPAVTVLVVDTRGRYLEDVTVVARGVGALHPTDPDRILASATDASGAARWAVDELERLAASGAADGVSFGVERFLGAAALPRRIARGSLADTAAGPPLELVVDAARVEVAAREPGGRAFSGRFGASVKLVARGVYTSKHEPGPLCFWVPRGVPYAVRVYGAALYDDVGAEFDAIDEAEADRRHELALGRQLGALTGRALDPSGAPCPAGTELELVPPGPEHGGDSATVSQSGRFLFRVRPRSAPAGDLPGAPRDVSTLALLRASANDDPTFGLEALVATTAPRPGETLDLGDVVLCAREVLVAGRVVAPEGVRVDGVELAVEWLEPDGTWTRVPSLNSCVSSAQDGRFAVHGALDDPCPPLRLVAETHHPSVTGRGFTAVSPQPVRAGATDVVVELVPTAGVAFTLEAGELGWHQAFGDLGYETLDLAVTPKGHASPLRLDDVARRFEEDPDAKGRYVVEGLPVGVVTLELRLERGPVLGSLEAVQLVPGRVVEAGVLRREHAPRAVTLTVAPSAAHDGAVVRYGPADSGVFPWQTEVHSGAAPIATIGAPVDVLIGATAFAPSILQRVDADTTVTLAPLPELALHVRGLSALRAGRGRCAGDEAFVLRLAPRAPEPAWALGPTLRRRHVFAARLDVQRGGSRSDTASFTRPLVPGVYRLSALLTSAYDSTHSWLPEGTGYPIVELGDVHVGAGVPRVNHEVVVPELARLSGGLAR